MRTQIIASLAAATLLFSACGGSSGSQGEVADLMIEDAEAGGIELDEGCVKDIAGELSDEDAEKMVAAGVDGEADISAEGQALGLKMLSCVDTDALVDQMVAELGDEIDADCLKDALKDVDLSAGEEALFGAMMQCANLGG
mgnify:CR=1 FL=1